jgi:FkbM family methyltransferase
LIVLENYTNPGMRLYELIPQTTAIVQSYANKMNPAKYIVYKMAESKKPGYVNVTQRGSTESSLESKGSVSVRLATIDDEVQEYNLPIGFIKTDIERYELKMLKGAIKTLKKQHSILSMSSSHSRQPMDIPIFLGQFGDYWIEFEIQG